MILWEITESTAMMSTLLHQRLHDFGATAQHRENKHWLASRLAILEYFKNEEVDLIKDEFNKPHLHVDDQEWFISITHSFEMAAVLISRDGKVAVDLERMDERINRVKNKFCSGPELVFAESCGSEARCLALIWAAKETMYKWYGKKELDFKKNLHVHPFGSNGGFPGQINGRIQKGTYFSEHTIKTDQIGDFVMTWLV